MDTQFWINAWNEGRTAFHQQNFNDKLVKYFPHLLPKEGQKVLVPLCGKTKDLLWLSNLKLEVHGVELHEDAVKDFFEENKLSPIKKVQDQDFIHYAYENIVINSGNFFRMPTDASYDFVYDRASLVALPSSMRKDYANVIKQSIKKGGKCLLIVYEYDQSKMDGPPFSISTNEIHDLYEDEFIIKLIESEKPVREGARLTALDESLKQKVYILDKI